MTLTGPSLPRALAVVATATAAGAGVAAMAVPVLVPTGSTPDGMLVAASAAVALLATAWLWLTTCAVAIGALRGRAPERGIPAPLRRAVLAGCGVALAGGLVAPAGATPGAAHEDRTSIAGLPFPDRAVAAALPGGAVLAVGHVAAARPVAPETVRVEVGDTLWAIAADDLAPAASDAEIDAHWREIYRLNRAEIGPDPDLIRPAQRLRLPHA